MQQQRLHIREKEHTALERARNASRAERERGQWHIAHKQALQAGEGTVPCCPHPRTRAQFVLISVYFAVERTEIRGAQRRQEEGGAWSGGVSEQRRRAGLVSGVECDYCNKTKATRSAAGKRGEGDGPGSGTFYSLFWRVKERLAARSNRDGMNERGSWAFFNSSGCVKSVPPLLSMVQPAQPSL